MKKINLLLMLIVLSHSIFSLSSEYVLTNKSRNSIMYSIEIDTEIFKERTVKYNGADIGFDFITPINRQILDALVPKLIPNSSEMLFSITSNESFAVHEILSFIISDIVIYTYDGNLVMTKYDLAFTKNIRSYEYDNKKRFYIEITEDDIIEGREKYAKNPVVNYEDYRLKYFDFLDIYYPGYGEMAGISTFFSNNAFGIGFHLLGAEFIPIPYIHVGLLLCNLDFYWKNDESSYLLLYCRPTFGFHYVINNDIKIYIDGIIKLGFEFIHKDPLFYYAPGFSVSILYKKTEFKYTLTYNHKFNYMNQISISWTDWAKLFKYRE